MAEAAIPPEGYTLLPAAAPAAPAAPPPEGYAMSSADGGGGVIRALGNAAASMAQNVSAGLQGTSPVVRDVHGKSNYQWLGTPIESDAGPAYVDSSGQWQMIDPTRHVILTDPGTHQPAVFARSANTDEGVATSLGRLVGFGATAPSAVAAPSVVAPVARTIGNVFASPDTQALTRLGGALSADMKAGGPSPTEIAGDMAQNANSVMTPLDAGGENLRALGGQAARVPGAGRAALTTMLNSRDADAGARLAADVPAATNNSNVVVGNTLQQIAKANAAPLYARAYLAAPLSPDVARPGGELGAMMARPSMQGAMKNALSIAAEEGRPPNSLGIGLNQAGDPVFQATPSWQTLDYVKRGLDDVLNGYRDSTTGRLNLDEAGHAVDQTRRQFLNFLDTANPDYAAARAAYSGPQQSRGALTRGANALNIAPDQITNDLSRLSPSDQQFYRLGAANALKATLAKTSSGGNEARAIVGNNYRQAQLRAIFPNADDLINSARQENTMFRTRNSVLGNSATAARVAQDVGSEGSGLLQPLGEALVAGATHEPMVAAKAGVSFLRTLMNSGNRMSPEVAEKIAGHLLQTDPQAAQAWMVNALGRSLGAYNQTRPLTPLVGLSAQTALPQQLSNGPGR